MFEIDMFGREWILPLNVAHDGRFMMRIVIAPIGQWHQAILGIGVEEVLISHAVI